MVMYQSLFNMKLATSTEITHNGLCVLFVLQCLGVILSTIVQITIIHYYLTFISCGYVIELTCVFLAIALPTCGITLREGTVSSIRLTWTTTQAKKTYFRKCWLPLFRNNSISNNWQESQETVVNLITQ